MTIIASLMLFLKSSFDDIFSSILNKMQCDISVWLLVFFSLCRPSMQFICNYNYIPVSLAQAEDYNFAYLIVASNFARLFFLPSLAPLSIIIRFNLDYGYVPFGERY